MALRVCAEPGCPELGATTRCTTHTRERDRVRGTSTQRGYGSAHQRERVRWQNDIDAGQVVTCWRCGRRLSGRAWDLGHDDDNRARYRGPECIPCNRATSSRRT